MRMQGGGAWFAQAEIQELVEIGLAEWPGDEEIPPEGLQLHIRSTVLTFGAKTSVPISTLITRQPLRKWRSQGRRVGHLLDDYAFADPVSAESVGCMRDQAIRDLEEMGFLLNFVKSILTPTQLLKWLGVLINSVTMRLHAMPKNVVAMEADMVQFVETRDVEVAMRNLTSHAGRMLSMGVALIPVRMTLQAIFKHIRPSRYTAGWEALVPKQQGMLNFMQFWMPAEAGGEGNLRKWNHAYVGSPIVPELRLDQLELTVDAGELVGYKLNRVGKPLQTPTGVSTQPACD